MSNVEDPTLLLVRALEELGPGFLVVVTGAGISLASGIPTFRGTDPGAIWSRDVTELATYATFRRDPVVSWQWYLQRFDAVRDCRPNPGHRALADLERWHVDRGGRFLLVTQNIDSLHEHAGSQRLIKVHGSADRVRCATVGCEFGEPRGSLPRDQVDLIPFRTRPTLASLPRCPSCGDFIRQHVLWFDEYYDAHEDYGWPAVQQAAVGANLVLFVGTSFSVGVTELFLQLAAANTTPCFTVDPGAQPPRLRSLVALKEPAESLLPSVLRCLVEERGETTAPRVESVR